MLGYVRSWGVARSALKRLSGAVHVGMLVYPVSRLGDDIVVNGLMAVGILVHRGVEGFLEPGECTCEVVDVWGLVGEDEIVPVAARFVRRGVVAVCGSPDGFFGGVPVEVKTTRRELRAEPRWRLQAGLYAWLFKSGHSYLDVVNVVRGEERVWRCRALGEEEVRRLVAGWLKGEDPVSLASVECEPVEVDEGGSLVYPLSSRRIEELASGSGGPRRERG